MAKNEIFEVDRSDPEYLVARGSDMQVTVAGHTAGVFHRRAVKRHLKTGNIEFINVLVCELNGVRVYINGENIIVTTEDINF